MKTIKRPQPRPVPREAAEDEVVEVEEGGQQQSGDRERLMFYLAVAYCANIGGTGTLTAEETNIIIMVSSQR